MIEHIKKKRRIIFAVIVIVCVLSAAFFLQNSRERTEADGEATNHLENSASIQTDPEGLPEAGSQKASSSETEEVKASVDSQQPAKTNKVATNDTLTTSSKQADSIASEPKTKATPQTNAETTCSLSINCSAILNNLDKLTKGKEGLIPSDGSLLNLTNVKFEKGDTVFDVLKRELKSRGVHLEFSKTPALGTVYIEGICNLYEFDCGELSGWKYAVNGVYPNYSCSEYALSDGDVITWEYTCG